MSGNRDESSSLQEVYAQRRETIETTDIYSIFNVANFFATQQRQRHVRDLLAHIGITDLASKRLLEVGCGKGDVVSEWRFLRIPPANYHGIDLLDRVEIAQQRHPGSGFAQANGQALPYPAQTFDIVLQYTVFTSVLNQQQRAMIAAEMQRVLAPNGVIIWYDFWLNPTNPNTRGIRKAEIKDLFKNSQITFRRITLAPPIARRLVPLSWTVALLLEHVKVFNSHFLALIQPE